MEEAEESPEEVSFTLSEALDSLGFGRAQVLLGFVTGWIYMADGLEMMLMSYVIPVLVKEWELAPWQGPLIASVIFVGMLIGAYPCGFVLSLPPSRSLTLLSSVLSDKYGRKRVLRILMVIGCTGAMASVVAPGFYSMLFFRTLMGVALGGAGPNSFSLFAEQLPVTGRGFYLTFISLFWCLGSIVEAGLAWYGLDTSYVSSIS